MLTKRCFKCGGPKPLDEFYRHSEMADGHLNKCKTCTRADVRANRAAKAEQYRAYDRVRTTRPERRASLFAAQRKDPAKRRAHVAVTNALRRGKLVKQPCEICGDAKVDAHHDDYSKPLDVRWLCRRHHVDHHFPAAAASSQPFLTR